MKTYSLVLTVGLVLLAVEFPVLWILIALAALIQIAIWCITGDLYEFFKHFRDPSSGGAFSSSSQNCETVHSHEAKEKDLQVLKKFLKQIKLNLWEREYWFGDEHQKFQEEITHVIKGTYDWDLAACMRAIPAEIFNTTAELTIGSEEEREAHYHNNLLRIKDMMQKELELRMDEDTASRRTGVAASSN